MTRILTQSGKHLDFADPQPEQIDVLDIIIGLARESRFAGQTKSYHAYSVAQHCVLASQAVEEEFALEALLHDASEAYMKDIPRPLKLLLPDYRAIECRVDAAIRVKFGLPREQSGAVTEVDRILLATERRDVMPHDDTEWPILQNVQPLDKRISPVAAQRAEQMFTNRLLEIMQK